MHIPQSTTDAITLERFDPALQAALCPSPDYDVEKWLYVPNSYSEYRYILGSRGKKPLICIGINPSTAAPDALDPTLQSVNRIALVRQTVRSSRRRAHGRHSKRLQPVREQLHGQVQKTELCSDGHQV